MTGVHRAINIRFNEDNPSDMELYGKLLAEAVNHVSVTSLVKKIIRDYFDEKKTMQSQERLREQIVSAVREEMNLQTMKILGVLLSDANSMEIKKSDAIVANGVESHLPEESDDIPEAVLNFISE